MSEPAVHLLGIRHHGPGSARAVARALEQVRPDIVLIEGPPEADPLVAWALDDGLRPPVALLAYPSSGDAAAKASFWPFGEFSPEWQAIRWAVTHEVPVRFIDLPAAIRFAAGSDPADESTVDSVRQDPIGELASAAGYDDPERWWEDVVEHQTSTVDGDALAPFEAIAAAMGAVRQGTSGDDERREAYMRQQIRAARKAFATVVVVCGAWHVPALTDPLPPAAHDTRTLKGLARTKVNLTWVPWTHGRLASWRGYGAGVTSPGWYHHLFTAPDRVIERWLVAVAAVLRAEGLPVSSAHVIEAVRLAQALATLRGRPLAGLAEVTDATRAVLCDGDELRVELVNRRLVIGERLGEIPADTPGVPLARDLAATQKRLRFPPSAGTEEKRLDLRREIDADRSRLLHRLRLLDVPWGKPVEDRGGRGTFWEAWRLEWQPEFAVDVIAASAYGATVPAAATTRAVELAGAANTLGEVSRLVQRCLLADLPGAFGRVLRALSDRMALDTDVAHLMDALPELARTLRYGDVRGTDVASLRVVTATMLTRIRVGFAAAVTGLDEDAARAMKERVDAVHSAVPLLSEEALGEWLDAVAKVADRADLPGLLGGRFARLLHDAGRLDRDTVGRRLGAVLTVGVPPAHGAAWIEGFVAGGGLVLLHDEPLLRLVDSWLQGIPAGNFDEVLPLLRRTFGAFPAPHRRAIGERVRRWDSADAAPAEPAGPHERGDLVLPTVELLLGVGRG
ncbi:hypothetical protein Val02_76660 [Virgisporangium aliadipatigenens]|uniref:Uncharacterized protein n=1 Tax=Virgisporangium aliadipatigenens TaxID=741659 RepID=A0A8J3YVX1_9ACTN|nr:DUF5682 family protein [Virgisporangium aliadipatigenens]GIJ50780.1 hypothetical protein Val02_76660 [Virgisporangium aliadipatigenens]